MDGKEAVLGRETGGGGQVLFWLSGAIFLGAGVHDIYTPQLQSWVSLLRSTPMKMERIESSETSALKLRGLKIAPPQKNTAFNTR